MGMISDADQKLAAFSASFVALKESFDRATVVQTVFYTCRISQDMRRLGRRTDHHLILEHAHTIISRSDNRCTEVASPAGRFRTTTVPSGHPRTHDKVHFGVDKPSG
jgi:hypothetical protein